METFRQKWKRRVLHYTDDFKQKIHPTWLDHPLNVQIDTHNYCNLSCSYCNVKEGGPYNLPRGQMPMEMIKYIIDYWGKRGVTSFALYINGEPLLDKRLLKICDYIAEHTEAHAIVDTNGTVWENRHLLIHPNLKIVRFTISANTPKTYKVVHGQPYYETAIKTLKWFLRNKYDSQELVLHFIVTKDNEHELKPYMKRFVGIHMRIFPLHRIPGIQLQSEKVVTKRGGDWWKNDDRQPNRPLIVWPNGKIQLEYFSNYETCQGTWSFSVAWNGRLLHCTDIPYKYNYGHIYEKNMLKTWHLRNKMLRTHPACSRCNVRNPNWEKIMNRYKI